MSFPTWVVVGVGLTAACGGAPFGNEELVTEPPATPPPPASTTVDDGTDGGFGKTFSQNTPATPDAAPEAAPVTVSTDPPPVAQDAGTDAATDAAIDAACALSVVNTHQNGFGGTWRDCIPAGTYAPVSIGLAEAVAACNSSPFSNGNTCWGNDAFCVPYATNIPVNGGPQYYWVVGTLPPGSAGDGVWISGQNVFVQANDARGPVNCGFTAPVSTWN